MKPMTAEAKEVKVNMSENLEDSVNNMISSYKEKSMKTISDKVKTSVASEVAKKTTGKRNVFGKKMFESLALELATKYNGKTASLAELIGGLDILKGLDNVQYIMFWRMRALVVEKQFSNIVRVEKDGDNFKITKA